MPNYTATHGINGALFLDVSSAGTLAVGTSTLTRIYGPNGWSADNSRDFVDTTAMGDTSKTSIPGLPNAACDVTGVQSFTGSGSLIKNIVGSTTERGFMLFPDINNYPGWFLSGKAFASQKTAGSSSTAVTLDLHFEAGSSGLTWTVG